MTFAVDGLLLDAANIPDRAQYPANVEIKTTVLGRELLQGRVRVWPSMLRLLLERCA